MMLNIILQKLPSDHGEVSVMISFNGCGLLHLISVYGYNAKNTSRVMKTLIFAKAKTKTQIICAVNAHAQTFSGR